MEHYIGSISSYSCQECAMEFENHSQFQQHFLNSHSEVLYRCNVCLKVFAQLSAFQEHMSQQHMQLEMGYSCAACPTMKFESYELLENHVLIMHERNDGNGTAAKTNGQKNASKHNGTPETAGPSSKAYHLEADESLTATTSLSTTIKCSLCNDSVPANEMAKHYLQHASSGNICPSSENENETKIIIKSEIDDFRSIPLVPAQSQSALPDDVLKSLQEETLRVLPLWQQLDQMTAQQAQVMASFLENKKKIERIAEEAHSALPFWRQNRATSLALTEEIAGAFEAQKKYQSVVDEWLEFFESH